MTYAVIPHQNIASFPEHSVNHGLNSLSLGQIVLYGNFRTLINGVYHEDIMPDIIFHTSYGEAITMGPSITFFYAVEHPWWGMGQVTGVMKSWDNDDGTFTVKTTSTHYYPSTIGDANNKYTDGQCHDLAVPHCAQSIDGGNWQLVRHTYNKWFAATDSLTGTADYGEVTGPLSDNEFAIPFDAEDDTEFLFSFGGCDKWLITTYDQFGYKWGANYEATILKSHTSDSPYTARWYNRNYACEDPWISWSDHSTASMIYGECSWGAHPIYSGEYLNVWMRLS